MGKKIVLAVFGGIAIFGLLLTIVGFALGGRPGVFNIQNNRVVYYTDGQQLDLFEAPYFARRYSNNTANHSGDSAPNPVMQGTPHQGTAPTAQLLEKVEVEISAGYLVIQPGDVPGLTVDGEMEYISTFEDGTWRIESIFPDAVSRGNRFWWNGQDITTTFTLTLPRNFASLEMDIGMGKATVEELALEELECITSMGESIFVNVTAEDAVFDVGMGRIDVMGFAGNSCTLNCDMGSLSFDGTVQETFDADCSMGSLQANLSGVGRYAGKADVGMGQLRVANYRGSGSFSGDAGYGGQDELQMNLECGMGSLRISFVK